MKLPQLPQDKANHVIYGAVIFNLVLFLTTYAEVSDSVFWAAISVIVFALGKELIDYVLNKIEISKGLLPNHGVEWYDAAATMVGGILAILPIIIFCL